MVLERSNTYSTKIYSDNYKVLTVEKTVIEQILEKMPPDARIANHSYEGANIVVYTKSKSFFEHGGDTIRYMVDEFKKRIDLRADSSIRTDEESTLKFIEKTMPKDAEITNVLFEPARSLVTIESKMPGKAIGKEGENLKAIRSKTSWTPIVRRESIIPSKITQNIRNVLYQDSAERRKFLDNVGKRIYEIKKNTGEEMWARVSFLGGGRQVGRSCMLLQTPESNILIDCGVDVASEKYPYPYLSAPELHIEDIDAVVITHSHVDHSGLVPLLFKFGYNGPIYCTAPTRDIMALLALDYIKVSHAQAKKPPYESTDIKQMVKNTIILDYEEVSDITPDIRLTLYNAGHILGSAIAHFHIGDGWHNLVYTGDFKFNKTKLLDPAICKFPRVETLIMESTYGSPDEGVVGPRIKSDNELKSLIIDTVKRKGKILVPVLGVGRAQEVMLLVEELHKENKIKDVPVFVDGMVWDVTAVHNAYPSFMNKDVRKGIFYEGHDPFACEIFKQVGSTQERREMVFERKNPCVVLATSGMLVGGPSVEYLKELSGDSKNQLVFVSYQGEGSLGARIQRGDRDIMVDRTQVKINMGVNTVSLTGHSDWDELVDYVRKIQPKPKKVIVMHGKSERCLTLASTIHKNFKIETVCPKNLEVIRLR